MEGSEPNQDLGLDVDLMILDYLAHKAVESVIHARRMQRSEKTDDASENCDGNLHMVNSEFHYPLLDISACTG